MGLSNELISQFAKITNDNKKVPTESTIYGTTVMLDGRTYVKLDGSDRLTPVETTTVVGEDERVIVTIKNHTATITGNISSPAAQDKTVKELGNKIGEFDTVIADTIKAETANIESAIITKLDGKYATFEGLDAKYASVNSLEAAEGEIGELKADNVDIKEKLTARDAEIDQLKANSLSVEVADAKYATIETLEATTGEFNTLKSAYGEFKITTTDRLDAIEADIADLDVESLNTKYANIDFTNIGKAAMENFYANSGLIQNVVVGDQTITGELVGVTIRGDRIIGGSIVADKLVIKGNDGIYYKLNAEGGATPDQLATEEFKNGLHGSNIIANSITAEKIDVKDLVAFDATIGGFNIGSNSIYSGAKSSVGNTTRGIYMDTDGQMNLGDSNNFLKFYKDQNGAYKLAISADSLTFSSGTSVEDAINDVQDSVDNLQIGGRNLVPNSEWIATKEITSSYAWGTNPKNVYVTYGETYTLSMYYNGVRQIGNTYGYAYAYPFKSDGTRIGTGDYLNTTSLSTKTIDNEEIAYLRIQIGPRNCVAGDVYQVKLEKGNKPTDWTPAPEDVATDISAAQSTANTAVTNAATAQTSADNAQSTANTANSTANTANTTANNALTKANAAQPGVSHSVSGGGNANMYICFATLKINYAYVNYPINFRVVSRGYEASDVQIMFNSINGTDPTLSYIRANGNVPIYIVKTETSTWKVIMKKNEAYGNCVITQYYNPTSVTVTWTSDQIASLPTGYVQASGLQESKTATNYMNFDNGLIIGDMTASKLGNNVFIDNDSVDIRNGDTVLASYGANTIYLGKNKDAAIVNICDGFAQLEKYALDAGGEWHGLSISSVNSVGLAAANEITMTASTSDADDTNRYHATCYVTADEPWNTVFDHVNTGFSLGALRESRASATSTSWYSTGASIDGFSEGRILINAFNENNDKDISIGLYTVSSTIDSTIKDGMIVFKGDGLFKNSLSVTGATTLTTLTTSSTATITGALTAKSTASITGALTVSNTITGNSLVSKDALSVATTATITGALTAKSTLAVTGATTLTGALTAKSTASISGDTTLGGILYMPNNKPIYMKNASGAYRQTVYIQGDNLYRFGYGGYANSEGRTDLLGNEIKFYVKYANDTNYKPYWDGGDTVSFEWYGAGFISSSASSVYFSIPLSKPMIGGCTVSISSVDGMAIRQNNTYVYGSSASSYAKPSSYAAVIDSHGGFVRVKATMSNTTNAINNAPCGIAASIKLTFAYG